MNLLDRRFCPFHNIPGLPDLPEVRKLMRLSWLNGFTFGAFEHQVADARVEALAAIGNTGLWDEILEGLATIERDDPADEKAPHLS